MEKYINESDKEAYRNVELSSLFSSDLFHKPKRQFEDDESFALHTNLGSLTVVDRLTGFIGYVRDTESGFRDVDGNFWLASGMLDVRKSECKTIGEAIEWVKTNANTCVPKISRSIVVIEDKK